MPRFHLHMRHGPDRVEDIEGAEYTDLMSARANALAAAREILSQRAKQGNNAAACRIEIADHVGEIWLIIPVLDAIQPDQQG